MLEYHNVGFVLLLHIIVLYIKELKLMNKLLLPSTHFFHSLVVKLYEVQLCTIKDIYRERDRSNERDPKGRVSEV